MVNFSEEELEGIPLGTSSDGVTLLHGDCHIFAYHLLICIEQHFKNVEYKAIMETDVETGEESLLHVCLHINGKYYDAIGVHNSIVDVLLPFDYGEYTIETYTDKKDIRKFFAKYALHGWNTDYSKAITQFIQETWQPQILEGV